MISSLLISAGIVLASAVAAELVLRRTNPYRLWRDAFDEGEPTEFHSTRGWSPKRDYNFRFHHRYLPRTNDIRLNHLGMNDANTYAKKKPRDVFRVAFFGGSTSAGWEIPAECSQAAYLQAQLARRMPGRRIEVMNASARLYSTGQLYKWFTDELAEYEPDLVVYYFNINHPRRTITVHESGKAPSLSQPVFTLDSQRKPVLENFDPATHENDMIFVDEDGSCIREKGRTDRSLHKWLIDRSHLYTVIDDWRQGQVRLRQFKDRKEIKDIERRKLRLDVPVDISDLPYQWQVVATLLGSWSEQLRKTNTPFLIMSHLAYYCTRDGSLFSDRETHPWGFAFDEIPERRYLSFLSRKLGFTYLDSFAKARDERTETEKLYVHPRYAYLNEHGTEWHAQYLADVIETLEAPDDR